MQNTPPPNQALQSAVAHHRQGNLAAAERLYQTVLAAQPRQFDALNYLGLLHLQQNRPADALPLLERALAVNPRAADALAHAAGVLMVLGRPSEALTKFNSLLALRPNDPDTQHNRGVVLSALGRKDEAIAAYCAAVALQGDHWGALFNLGNEYSAVCRYLEALDCYDKVLSSRPNHVDVLTNCGTVLAKLGRPEEALQRFDRALAIDPDNLLALTNRANALQDLNQCGQALAEYDRVVTADPNYVDALFNRGNALIDLGRPYQAIDSLGRALRLRPDSASIHASYANALFDGRQADGAIAAFRRAVQLAPDDANLHTNLIFALNFDSSATAADHQKERMRWAERYKHLSALAPAHANKPDPERRLRVGYFSPYFRAQAATFSFGGVLLCHDLDRFDLVCYSDTREEDDITERLRERATIWRRTVGLSDDELARLVRADEIDILVDLVGHMRGHRLPLFARKPAPIQVTAWGEPTGTGLPAIDYLFADPVLVPEMERALLAERVCDLPSFLGYWTPHALAEPGPLPATANGYVTFGSFNRFSKLLDPVLRLWAQILRAVPNSRLVLKDGVFDGAGQKAPILELMAAEGVASERVTVLDKTDRAGHFASYQQIDIALDPFPHAGGMTTLDALWMGLPVITRPGRTISSRLAAALLSAAGLSQLIASDLGSYVALAVRLAGDLDALGSLRQSLRPRLASSAIGDMQCYTRAVEAAYREMWRRWCVEH